MRRNTVAARVRDDAWRWFAIAVTLLTAGYFLLPSTEAQDLAYQVPEMLAVVAVLVGIRVHRPTDARPWVTLACGLALTTAGDWTWVLLEHIGIEPFPSVADVFYLGGMGLVAVALLWLAHGRFPSGDRASLLDALIVAVGAGMLSWVFLMAPLVADDTQSIGAIAVALAYPLLDIGLLAVLVRLVLAPGAQPMSLRLIIVALVFFLAGDFPYAVLALADGYQTGQIVDAGWMLGAAAWGAAALHPTMTRIAQPVTDRSGASAFSTWRLVLLAGASLMGPAVLVIQWLNGNAIDVPVVAAGCVCLFLLVILRLDGVVGALRTTLDERAVLEKELEHRALHDPLTGLANRVLFHDRLTTALRRRQGSVAVMFLDLDDFKTVNDAYGHAAGDTVLRAVADALQGAIRDEDTVARLGGDEFAVLLADSPDRYEATTVAGRLLAAVELPVQLAGHQYPVGVSIGISLGAGGAASAESLMRDADIAMYVAKGQGKGTFTVFEPTEHHAVVRGIELRTDLDHAITRRQFELRYQPILSLDTGEVAGVEALVRWRHPTLGLLEPAEFIALAETTGAIGPLGEWILEEACRVAAGWPSAEPDAAGRGPAPRYMSVNLSAIQLSDPAFATALERILRSSGVAPQQVILEVTESARLETDVAAATLRRIRDLGVRLAIDDFGTGYAALGQLARMPFDLVKIEQSFVSTIGTDARAESLVAGIVDLARRLGVDVIAEGIEDGVQLARLREAGCAFGQGFHFSPPMTSADLEAFLADHSLAPAPAILGRARHARGSTATS
jgi:diguanylate cyclase (GGDEF)-like protein